MLKKKLLLLFGIIIVQVTQETIKSKNSLRDEML